MSPAELDTLAEPSMRADHPSAHVLGVAESAQGHRLNLDEARLPGCLERGPMLAQASLPVAPGKAQIAAQEVDARLLGHQILCARFRLGRLQIGGRAIEIVDPVAARIDAQALHRRIVRRYQEQGPAEPFADAIFRLVPERLTGYDYRDYTA